MFRMISLIGFPRMSSFTFVVGAYQIYQFPGILGMGCVVCFVFWGSAARHIALFYGDCNWVFRTRRCLVRAPAPGIFFDTLPSIWRVLRIHFHVPF